MSLFVWATLYIVAERLFKTILLKLIWSTYKFSRSMTITFSASDFGFFRLKHKIFFRFAIMLQRTSQQEKFRKKKKTN